MNNILYQIPYPATQYAYRSIFNGFKNGFTKIGCKFEAYTANDNLKNTLDRFKPNIFIIYLSPFHSKFIDFEYLFTYRKHHDLKVVTYVPYWNSPISSWRINEAPSLNSNSEHKNLINKGFAGDLFITTCEIDDYRMSGFTNSTKKKLHCVPLAADDTIINSRKVAMYKSDICYIGTNLPQKKDSFTRLLNPLKKNYDVKIYGQDWTKSDQLIGWVQRFGQYFKIKYISSIRKPSLTLSEEVNIYKSSAISINIHEEYQRKYGGDCNERTFKIPLYGGFEIVDNVECIKKYFKCGKEIVIGENEIDWFEKIEYYFKHPDERRKIIEAGMKRVLAEHTYAHRAREIIRLVKHES